MIQDRFRIGEKLIKIERTVEPLQARPLRLSMPGTYAAQAGFNAFMVRDLLGHKTMAMTGRYVEKATDPLRAAADVVSGRVAAAMSGGQGAEVVELPKRKA